MKKTKKQRKNARTRKKSSRKSKPNFRKALKAVFISSFSISLLFTFFSLIFYFGDWTRIITSSIFGFFIGLIAAPEFEPEAFKNSELFQLICGFFAGLVFGFFFNFGITGMFIGGIVGGLIGFSTSFWIDHISIP